MKNQIVPTLSHQFIQSRQNIILCFRALEKDLENVSRDIEAYGENTKRKLFMAGATPGDLIYEEEKKMVRYRPHQTQYEVNNDNPFMKDEGGIFYEDFGPQTMVKNTNIYNTDKEFGFNKDRVTTRASTAYRSTPL